jgi:hypothetical protein
VSDYTQKKPTEIWENNASCIGMSKNPANHDRSRHFDVKVDYLRDLVETAMQNLSNEQHVPDALTLSLAICIC